MPGGRPRAIQPSTEQRILELHAAGLSQARIAAQLTFEGVAAPSSPTWSSSSVQKVIERSAEFRHPVGRRPRVSVARRRRR